MNQSSGTPTDKQASSATPKSAENKAADGGSNAARLHNLVPEIRKQWTKLTDADLAGVMSQDDLTAKVEKTYAIPHDEAKKQVQVWAQGRQF